MDVKSEIEIKEEELDFEYQSFEYDPQIFPESETNFALLYNIKTEEFDEIIPLKSELREIKEESMLDEEQINIDDIKPEMIGKKLSYQHGKSLTGVGEQGEQGFKVKSSGSKPKMSGTFDQVIKEDCQDYIRCGFCHFPLKNREELIIHLKTHDKRKFKCTHCSYGSNRKDHLKYHLLTHSNLKLFKCCECNYGCNHKGDFKIHLLNHKNVKLFKCTECSYGCNRKSHLKTHMLTHSNFKLFKCSECNYECNYKSYLKTHLLTHSDLKLFKCSECGYESNHKGGLKKHLLTHSNLKLFKFSECNYECNGKGHLKTHVLKKHGTGTRN